MTIDSPGPVPQRVQLDGRFVVLRALDPIRDAEPLWERSRGYDELWRYMFDGPYGERQSFVASLEAKAQSADPLFFAIHSKALEHAAGWAALMRIEPRHRVIEVGNIVYTPTLQRTPGATEAMYLLAQYVFEVLRYRRYEWKCDALNERSRNAALRLGFTFEGIFRQHMIVKGHNRDTAWYSMLDREWPDRRAAFEKWLDPSNFDAAGVQIRPLRRTEL